MNEIGSIKKVDDAGRVVIPADIRKAVCMKNGDMVHITISDGRIVVKEYEKTKMKKMLVLLLKCFSLVYHDSLIVTNDNHDTLASFGSSAIHKLKFTEELISILQENMFYIRLEGDNPLYADSNKKLIVEVVYPIYIYDKIIGSLILMESKTLCDDGQLKSLEMLAHMIAEYLSAEGNL